MKTKHVIAVLLLLLLGSVALNVRQGVQLHKVAGSGSLQSAKQMWTCPMDPQIVRDHPGKCPICGMNLVPQTEASEPPATTSAPAEKETSADKKQMYQCPMHPSIVQDHPGDCPICGMKLVPMQAPAGTSTSSSTSGAAPRKIAYYRSPMNPQQTSPVPRKDEMGMDYVPVYEDEVAAESNVEGRATVTIDPTRQQLIGLRTAPVARGKIGSQWLTLGHIEADPTRVSKINVKTSGYVEHIFVDFVGKPVRRGEPLFAYYSPELLAAQREYLLALRTRNPYSTGATQADSILISSAREKLRLWDVPEAQIEKLEQTGEVMRTLTFVSPVNGVVTVKNVVEGSSLMPGDTPYEVTDLSTVWVLAHGYQNDVARAKIGMPATVTVELLPGRVFHGTVAFVDPILDPQTRTFMIRINAENSTGELKPDMFVEVQFQTTPHEALTVPSDAVIPSGRGNMVFVSVGDGKFQPRAITVGDKSGDDVEVLDGLAEGELVVMRANFLVDSESSLRAALAAVGGSR